MDYYVVDAFAERIFTGNPAGICILDEWIDDHVMQSIAAENNLSETAFIVKHKNSYGIRWFTPKYEIDLCGHATLASAFVISNFIQRGVEEISFISGKSGELKVYCSSGKYTLDFPARVPSKLDNSLNIDDILGTKVQEILISRDLFAVVDSEKTVKSIKPNFDKMKQLGIGDGIIVTAKGNNCDFVSRCFYPKCGVDEDPVTGSAHCNLIPYWAQKLGKSKMLARQLSDRGGTLECELAGSRVKISGMAVLYSRGNIYI